MKQLFGKRWHRIPVVLVSALLVTALVTGGVLAAVVVRPVTQTISQIITPQPVPNSIDVPDITLGNVVAGAPFEYNSADHGEYVTVGVTDFSTLFTATLGNTEGYTNYSIELTLEGFEDPCITLDKTNLSGSILLNVGTMRFSEKISGTAGDIAGTTEVIVTFTLDYTP